MSNILPMIIRSDSFVSGVNYLMASISDQNCYLCEGLFGHYQEATGYLLPIRYIRTIQVTYRVRTISKPYQTSTMPNTVFYIINIVTHSA